jgi:hypothetical protein
MMMIVMTTMTMLLSEGQTIQLTFQYDLLPLASKIIRCKLTKRISRKFQQDGVHKPCIQRATLPGVVLLFSSSVRNGNAYGGDCEVYLGCDTVQFGKCLSQFLTKFCLSLQDKRVTVFSNRFFRGCGTFSITRSDVTEDNIHF